MHLEESSGEQLRRLEQQIARLRHDATIWQTAGERETAQELRAFASVLRGVVEAIVRTERVLSFVRPQRTQHP
jgi:Ribonuclease G/E